MAIYAVGDIQGCLNELQRLLDSVKFDPARDRLWAVGDLVSRGRQSLQTLRYLRALGPSVVAVLGNHDLHLLAINAGVRKAKANDRLTPVLQAQDKDELLHWLRGRALMHHDETLGYSMIHAGLAPQWDLQQALACARELESVLRADHYEDFLMQMYGDEPAQWSDDLQGWDRLRVIANSFTRLRYCDTQGRMDLKTKTGPGNPPAGMLPWFEIPGRKSKNMKIVCGHWSTLGFTQKNGVTTLDTGCVWGGQLSALRLDCDPAQHSAIDCTAALDPLR